MTGGAAATKQEAFVGRTASSLNYCLRGGTLKVRCTGYDTSQLHVSYPTKEQVLGTRASTPVVNAHPGESEPPQFATPHFGALSQQVVRSAPLKGKPLYEKVLRGTNKRDKPGGTNKKDKLAKKRSFSTLPIYTGCWHYGLCGRWCSERGLKR